MYYKQAVSTCLNPLFKILGVSHRIESFNRGLLMLVAFQRVEQGKPASKRHPPPFPHPLGGQKPSDPSAGRQKAPTLHIPLAAEAQKLPQISTPEVQLPRSRSLGSVDQRKGKIMHSWCWPFARLRKGMMLGFCCRTPEAQQFDFEFWKF